MFFPAAALENNCCLEKKIQYNLVFMPLLIVKFSVNYVTESVSFRLEYGSEICNHKEVSGNCVIKREGGDPVCAG